MKSPADAQIWVYELPTTSRLICASLSSISRVKHICINWHTRKKKYLKSFEDQKTRNGSFVKQWRPSLNAVFHQGIHCLLRQERNISLEIISRDTSICTQKNFCRKLEFFWLYSIWFEKIISKQSNFVSDRSTNMQLNKIKKKKFTGHWLRYSTTPNVPTLFIQSSQAINLACFFFWCNFYLVIA